MNDSALTRFFGVVARPQTWLGILFHVPGVPARPVLLRVPRHRALGRRRARGRLGRHPDPARGRRRLVAVRRLRTHPGALPARRRRRAGAPGVGEGRRRLGQAQGPLRQRGHVEGPRSTCSPSSCSARSRSRLLVVAVSMVGWFLAIPFFAVFDVPHRQRHVGAAALVRRPGSVPLGILVFFVSLHVLNGWSWVCARWAEVMFRGPLPRRGARLASAGGPPGAAAAAGRSPHRRRPPPPLPPPAAGGIRGRRAARQSAAADAGSGAQRREPRAPARPGETLLPRTRRRADRDGSRR